MELSIVLAVVAAAIWELILCSRYSRGKVEVSRVRLDGDVKKSSCSRAVVWSCGRAFGRAGFQENLVSAPVKRVVR